MDISIYIKDSIKNMSEIDTASVDLIITSPPYWNLIDYEHSQQLGINLSYKQFFYYLKFNLLECMRVLKEDALVCFIVGDIRTGKYSRGSRPCIFSMQSDLIQFFTVEMDFDLFQHYIWEKYGIKKGEKAGIIYGSVCKGKDKEYAVPPYLYNDLLMEHVLIFRKPGLRVLPSLEERRKEELNVLLKSQLTEWLKPVWHINSSCNPEHDATFPSELAERLIRIYSLKGDVILDPFCGTCTTLKKAIEWRRNAIGYEINENYVMNFVEEFKLKKENNRYYTSIECDLG